MKGTNQRMDSRYYPGVEADVTKLTAELRKLFDENFEVQTMHISNTVVLQARKTNTLRELTGLSAALTIKITPEAGGTRVEIGMQKWFDKAAVAAVALFLSAGLLVALPALGAYWQHKLTENAWKVVEDHIAQKAGGYIPPLPGRCGTCGAANTVGSTYCSTCGANLQVGRTCPSCGAPQRETSARFCNRCGKTLIGPG
ncbi:MAG TPA: zinc ribbon domain-containing protein [Pyrinomonadaceae bacterium]|nr:zinc ribbon domain-containing protein [Pyrinomonadaceae bacterium]